MGVLALALFAVSTDGFLEQANLRSLAASSALVGLVAVGMTFITMSGNILSLSLGVTAAASTLLFLATLQYGIAVALALTVLLGVVSTGLQGVLIGWLGANPIIVTVAANSVVAGLALQITGGDRVGVSGGGGSWLRSDPLGVPFEFLAFAVVAVAGHLILARSSFGRAVALMGTNRDAARVAGVRLVQTTTGVYAFAGMTAALVGVLLAARYGATGFAQGRGDGIQYDFDAIAAVVIGGTAIEGGRGSVPRSVLGVAFLAVLGSVLLLRGLETEWQILVKGLLVLAVILALRGHRDGGSG